MQNHKSNENLSKLDFFSSFFLFVFVLFCFCCSHFRISNLYIYNNIQIYFTDFSVCFLMTCSINVLLISVLRYFSIFTSDLSNVNTLHHSYQRARVSRWVACASCVCLLPTFFLSACFFLFLDNFLAKWTKCCSFIEYVCFSCMWLNESSVAQWRWWLWGRESFLVFRADWVFRSKFYFWSLFTHLLFLLSLVTSFCCCCGC